MNISLPAAWVDTPAALDALCERLARHAWFVLDTEFLREKTYYPKLCLVQVATPEEAACIDPLALSDLTPLLGLLADRGITKVLHSARQDMEIFYHLCGAPPAPVFDTQLAAPLLGFADQIGYANLVRELTGVTLDKLHTRADWSRRPLSVEQLRYAGEDVIYLVSVYQRLHERLLADGRLEWLADDFRQLSEPALYAAHPEHAWRRVKGINRLRGASLAVLQALAAWREQQAQASDRPRGWIMKDEVMIDVARRRPDTLAALSDIRGLAEAVVKRSGNELLVLVAAAAQKRPEKLPQDSGSLRLDENQQALVDLMMAVVRISAMENRLNPAVLASRKQLESVLAGDTDTAVMQGWRRRLVGERLQQLLRGELRPSVQDGRIVL